MSMTVIDGPEVSISTMPASSASLESRGDLVETVVVLECHPYDWPRYEREVPETGRLRDADGFRLDL